MRDRGCTGERVPSYHQNLCSRLACSTMTQANAARRTIQIKSSARNGQGIWLNPKCNR